MPDTSRPPLDRVREELGISIRELAEISGCSYNNVFNGCRGLALPPRRVLGALADLGIDAAALRAEQVRWQEERAQETRAALKGRLMAQRRGAGV
jgi:hypothetical protein